MTVRTFLFFALWILGLQNWHKDSIWPQNQQLVYIQYGPFLMDRFLWCLKPFPQLLQHQINERKLYPRKTITVRITENHMKLGQAMLFQCHSQYLTVFSLEHEVFSMLNFLFCLSDNWAWKILKPSLSTRGGCCALELWSCGFLSLFFPTIWCLESPSCHKVVEKDIWEYFMQ